MTVQIKCENCDKTAPEYPILAEDRSSETHTFYHCTGCGLTLCNNCHNDKIPSSIERLHHIMLEQHMIDETIVEQMTDRFYRSTRGNERWREISREESKVWCLWSIIGINSDKLQAINTKLDPKDIHVIKLARKCLHRISGHEEVSKIMDVALVEYAKSRPEPEWTEHDTKRVWSIRCPLCEYEETKHVPYDDNPNDYSLSAPDDSDHWHNARSNMENHVMEKHHCVVCHRCRTILMNHGEELDHLLAEEDCLESMLYGNHGSLLVMLMKNIQFLKKNTPNNHTKNYQKHQHTSVNNKKKKSKR